MTKSDQRLRNPGQTNALTTLPIHYFFLTTPPPAIVVVTLLLIFVRQLDHILRKRGRKKKPFCHELQPTSKRELRKMAAEEKAFKEKKYKYRR